MFSPYPAKSSGWWVIPAQLKNGKTFDLRTGKHDITWEMPKDISKRFKSRHWRKYLSNISKKKYSKYRLYYGKYLCRSWNRDHKGDEQLESFKIYYMKKSTPKPGEPEKNAKKIKIWSHNCFKKT